MESKEEKTEGQGVAAWRLVAPQMLLSVISYYLVRLDIYIHDNSVYSAFCLFFPCRNLFIS